MVSLSIKQHGRPTHFTLLQNTQAWLTECVWCGANRQYVRCVRLWSTRRPVVDDQSLDISTVVCHRLQRRRVHHLYRWWRSSVFWLHSAHTHTHVNRIRRRNAPFGTEKIHLHAGNLVDHYIHTVVAWSGQISPYPCSYTAHGSQKLGPPVSAAAFQVLMSAQSVVDSWIICVCWLQPLGPCYNWDLASCRHNACFVKDNNHAAVYSNTRIQPACWPLYSIDFHDRYTTQTSSKYRRDVSTNKPAYPLQEYGYATEMRRGILQLSAISAAWMTNSIQAAIRWWRSTCERHIYHTALPRGFKFSCIICMLYMFFLLP